jgi:hypothetical protein
MMVYTVYGEDGELSAEELNGRGDYIHTVLTREQTELRDRLYAAFDIEMEKEKRTGVRLYSSSALPDVA